jgi:hypothetical protein
MAYRVNFRQHLTMAFVKLSSIQCLLLHDMGWIACISGSVGEWGNERANEQ